jgi:RNA polymerase sigma-70 factor (ECF subfamily)
MPAQPMNPTWMWQETSRVLESTDDLASLESLVRQYSRFIFKVAYGVVRDSYEAEDVVQEVFLRVHKKGTKGVEDVRAWLATMAFRIAIDRIRQPRADELGDLEPPCDCPDAEQVAMYREQVKQVQRLIAALPDDLRYPLVLSAIEELSSPQIAVMLGVSEAAVRGRIFRARQLLQEKFAVTVGKKS